MRTEKAFNIQASSYDDVFSRSSIGIAQRAQVYKHLEAANWTNHPKPTLELNCGTGVDAFYFNQKGWQWTPTDSSKEMLRVTSDKLNQAFPQLRETSNPNQAEVLDMISAVKEKGADHEAVFSNFGGINCLNPSELENLCKTLGKVQKQKNTFVAVLMPKYCLVESLYFFVRLKWRKMFRRNTKKAVLTNVDGHMVNTYYHSPKQLKTYLRINGYHRFVVKPVAVIIPPSYMANKFKRNNRIFKCLLNIDKKLCQLEALSNYADHYILIAEKN